MVLSSFPNGLRNASDYLNPNNIGQAFDDIAEDVRESIIPTFQDNSLKEVICRMLASRGMLYPNSQVGINNSLDILCNLPNIQRDLKAALVELCRAYSRFMDHNTLDSVLSRISNTLSEILAISSMINFCDTVVDPIPIRSLLEDVMDSFLGGGQEINDLIGLLDYNYLENIFDKNSRIFQPQMFTGGILGDLGSRYSDVLSGSLDQSFIDEIIGRVTRSINQIEALIEKETTTKGIHENRRIETPTNGDGSGTPTDSGSGLGGTELGDGNRPFNTKLGVLFNADDEGIQGVVSSASRLKALYQSLSNYPVTDRNGVTYNNIFELFVDPELLELLRVQADPVTTIEDRLPVYDHCGMLIGYTTNTIQDQERVIYPVTPLREISDPGFQAGGRETNPLAVAQRSIPETTPFTTYDIYSSVVNVPTEVTFPDSITPNNNKIWFVVVQAVGKRTNGSDATSIRIEAIVRNIDTVVTLEGTEGNKTVFNSVGADNYDLVLGVSNNAFVVEVVGDDNHDVQWSVKLTYQEI